MDTIAAIKYQYDLKIYIDKCLSLHLTYDDIFEALTTDDDSYFNLSSFLQSKIGPIWLKKPYGLQYLTWQHGDSNG